MKKVLIGETPGNMLLLSCNDEGKWTITHERIISNMWNVVAVYPSFDPDLMKRAWVDQKDPLPFGVEPNKTGDLYQKKTPRRSGRKLKSVI